MNSVSDLLYNCNHHPRYLFSLVWGSADILFWKGVWDGYAYLTNYQVEMFMVSAVIGLTVLTSSRTVKSSLSTPV